LNPHNLNGQRILSPSCLPFHHAPNYHFLKVRRHPDSNWRMMDLQSTALPLGYAAIFLL
jgi:hypothetical protein